MEDDLKGAGQRTRAAGDSVSILVLMEDDLKDLAAEDVQINVGVFQSLF